jgi:hypothetical protein
LEFKKSKDFEKAFLESSRAIIYSNNNDSINLKFFFQMASALSFLGKYRESNMLIYSIEGQLNITPVCEENNQECLKSRIEVISGRMKSKMGF